MFKSWQYKYIKDNFNSWELTNTSFVAQCSTSTYKIQTTQFEKSTAIAKYMTEAYRKTVGIKSPNNTETYSVVINYDISDVVVSEEIQLTTLPDFISSVGGNLGLFIGFSCLPVLLKATEFFRNLKISSLLNLIIKRWFHYYTSYKRITLGCTIWLSYESSNSSWKQFFFHITYFIWYSNFITHDNMIT